MGQWRAVYIERCKYGSERGLHRPTSEMKQGGAFLLYRANLLEHQREGIAIAKRLGKYKGRHKIKLPDNWGEYFLMYKRKELRACDLMKHFGLKKNTLYNFIHASQKEFYSDKKSDAV